MSSSTPSGDLHAATGRRAAGTDRRGRDLGGVEQRHRTQTLDWAPEEGDWSVVVMNADGSSNVDANRRSGQGPFIFRIGLGLVIGGSSCRGRGGGGEKEGGGREGERSANAAASTSFETPPAA